MMVLRVGGFTIKLLFDKQLLFIFCLLFCFSQIQTSPLCFYWNSGFVVQNRSFVGFLIYFLNMLQDYWILHFSYFLISFVL